MSPLYEYRCLDPKCPQDRFTLRLAISQVPHYQARCPCCGGRAERIYSPPAGRFGDTPTFHKAGS